MLTFSYVKDASVLVVNSTAEISEEDVPAYRRALVQLDRDAISARVTPLTILVVEANAVRPDAKQRQALAELWNHTQAPLHLFALVTTSAFDRGILKVISWISPPGDHRRESVHSTFEEALSWSRGQRKHPIPDLLSPG
ncbi:MAG TPA: hypothetical protein VK550_06500 [Polyangiaceae bacterium]|nr:hypothetical protein [Polyangiaceae bacterium]